MRLRVDLNLYRTDVETLSHPPSLIAQPLEYCTLQGRLSERVLRLDGRLASHPPHLRRGWFFQTVLQKDEILYIRGSIVVHVDAVKNPVWA